MSENKLFMSFSGISPELIEESERRRPRRRIWIYAISAAACLALVLGAAMLPTLMTGVSTGRDIIDVLPFDGAGGPAPGDPGSAVAPGTGGDDPSYPEGPPEDKEEVVEPDMDKNHPVQPDSPDSGGLIFNDVLTGASPPVWFFMLQGTPLSEYQLELVWSADCPTALLEAGEEERWLFDTNLSGEALYYGDGELYCLRLTFRYSDSDTPVTVTVSDAQKPLFRGCIPTDDAKMSRVFGTDGIECLCLRYEYGDSVTLSAEFTIGADLYRVSVNTSDEDAGRELIFNTLTRFQSNYFISRYPDLGTFVQGDGTSGSLAGEDEDSRLLLELEAKKALPPWGDGTLMTRVYRDGRVERGVLWYGEFSAEESWQLTREELMELRGRFCGLTPEDAEKLRGCEHAALGMEEYAITAYPDPWQYTKLAITGCVEDNETVKWTVELLTPEG